MSLPWRVAASCTTMGYKAIDGLSASDEYIIHKSDSGDTTNSGCRGTGHKSVDVTLIGSKANFPDRNVGGTPLFRRHCSYAA
jgi:hypothetical protein